MSHSNTDKVRVTKRFTIDMAHALYGYDGPCKNIHGHTYHLAVTLLGRPIQDPGDVKLGMVMDFGDLKRQVKQYILDQFDHALILNEAAPYAAPGLIDAEFEKVLRVPYQPTCENLLLHFVSLLQPLFDHDCMLISVSLDETPTSSAVWLAGDQELTVSHDIKQVIA